MSKTTKIKQVNLVKNYTMEEAHIRMEALSISEKMLKTRVSELFNTPYMISNIEELAELIFKWAKTGDPVMKQIQANVEKAQKLKKADGIEPSPVKYS